MTRRRRAGNDPGERGRFSARRKTEAVLRLLRGEDMDSLSRELGVTAATLAGWRDHFLVGGQTALKLHPQAIATSPFLGEGYRKVWARLRLSQIRTSKQRVNRLMREAALLSPSRVPRARPDQAHAGTIITAAPDQMWGTDASSCLTGEGMATIFVAVDHCSSECIGLHA